VPVVNPTATSATPPRPQRTNLSVDELVAATTRMRRELFEVFADLDQDELSTLSLCTGWTVRDVAAHLAVATKADSREVLALALRCRGSFDGAMDLAVRNRRTQTMSEILEELRSRIDSVRPVPVIGYASPTVDIAAHSLDALVPIGREIPISAEDWPIVLSAATNPLMMRFFKVRIPTGVRLDATDAAWASPPASKVREAEPIQASARALLAAFTGRPILEVDPGAIDLARVMGGDR
jgi:uncharacterized protein (TIGR03083 family)